MNREAGLPGRSIWKRLAAVCVICCVFVSLMSRIPGEYRTCCLRLVALLCFLVALRGRVRELDVMTEPDPGAFSLFSALRVGARKVFGRKRRAQDSDVLQPVFDELRRKPGIPFYTGGDSGGNNRNGRQRSPEGSGGEVAPCRLE